MEIKTIVRFFMLLLLLIPAIHALSGGVEKAFAEDDQRKVFLVYITREGSPAVTTMRIRAEDIDEARNQAVLNGWHLIRVEETEPDKSDFSDYKFRYSGKNGKPQIKKNGDGTVIVDDNANSKKPTTDNLTASTKKERPDNKTFDYGDGDLKRLASDKSAILADDNYTYIGTIYFGVGEYTAVSSENLVEKIKALKASGEYLVLGHTDTLRVVENNQFDNNFDLSRKRGDFFRSLLSSYGISSVNVSVKGMGTLMPAAVNKTEGQPLNRRADLYERR